MKYSFDSRVRYSETDEHGRLSIGSLVNYFQDCAVFQAESIGDSFRDLEGLHRAWILASWQILIDRMPAFGERVQVSTWAYEFKVFYGLRNFVLADENGPACRANSTWILLDMDTMKPVRVPDEVAAAYGCGPKLNMPYCGRKIALPEAIQPVEAEHFRISEHHLDTNHHVNNGQYIQMALDELEETEGIKQLRIEYRQQAHLGDEICPQIYRTPELETVVLAGTDGKPYAVAEFTVSS